MSPLPKYLQMLVRQVDWGALDVLLLDLPPGTGDIQLTLAQAFPLSGAVVVMTPQDVSLKIARRGLRMMEQVKVPVLGVIENMSGFTCPSCGTVAHIVHQGGGEAIAQELGVAFLGKVPLEPMVVDCGDVGRSLVHAVPDSPAAQAYRHIVSALAGTDGDAAGMTTPFAWALADGSGKPAQAMPEAGGPANRLAGLDHDDARRRRCRSALHRGARRQSWTVRIARKGLLRSRARHRTRIARGRERAGISCQRVEPRRRNDRQGVDQTRRLAQPACLALA